MNTECKYQPLRRGDHSKRNRKTGPFRKAGQLYYETPTQPCVRRSRTDQTDTPSTHALWQHASIHGMPRNMHVFFLLKDDSQDYRHTYAVGSTMIISPKKKKEKIRKKIEKKNRKKVEHRKDTPTPLTPKPVAWSDCDSDIREHFSESSDLITRG